MPSAVQAANEFIRFAEADGMPVDQMKLQKLLFYSHAWNLAMRGASLFDERVEAWPWGPVIRSVYNETRPFGRRPIDSLLRETKKVGDGLLDYKWVIPDPIEDVETRAFLKQVWDSYRAYTGVQLSNATHAEGEPWTIVKDRIGHLEQKPIIPNELIAEVFKSKLANAQPADPPTR